MIRDVTALRRLADGADKRLVTLTIQTEVRFATPAEQHAFTYELADALEQLVTKYHREDAPEGPEFSFTLAGHPTVFGKAGQRGSGAGLGTEVLATQSV
jgi:hypothetical protein